LKSFWLWGMLTLNRWKRNSIIKKNAMLHQDQIIKLTYEEELNSHENYRQKDCSLGGSHSYHVTEFCKIKSPSGCCHKSHCHFTFKTARPLSPLAIAKAHVAYRETMDLESTNLLTDWNNLSKL
jgi:hypothetical protein